MVYEKLCLNCMKEKRSAEGRCQYCGFDNSSYQPKDFQLPPYTTLGDGRYIVGKVLGSGGFGITYIAFDRRLETPVAIKELFVADKVKRKQGRTVLMDTTENGVREYKDIKRRFMQEAKTMAELENVEGVVKVRDCFNENDTAYIVMEYLDGKTLKEMRRENEQRMSMDQAITLFEPLMRSLSQMHKAGIIHRDISLDNIMVTKDGRVKLIDLGGEKRVGNYSENDRTTIIKKSVYTPVEQIMGKSSNIGPWTDVYALAVTIYICICGIFPKAAGEREDDRDIKKPSEIGVKISPKQEEVLLKALAIDRKNRIQTVDQLLEGLKQGEEKPKRSKGPLVAGIVIAAGILIAVAAKEKLGEWTGKKEIPGTNSAVEIKPDISESITDTTQKNDEGIETAQTSENETGAEKTDEAETGAEQADKVETGATKADEAQTGAEKTDEVETGIEKTNEVENGVAQTGDSGEEVIAEPTQDAESTDGKWYCITSNYKDGIAVRSEPTGESDELTRLPKGTEFYVEKYSDNWGYTTVNGVTGWVALDYAGLMEYEADAWYYITSDYSDGIAVRSEANGESEELTRLSKGTEFYVEQTEKNWGYTTVNGVTGWVALDYASLMEYEAETWYRITNPYKKGIAVRSEPTGESEELTRIPKGTEFYVEQTEKNWGYTTVNGVTGWIALDYAEVMQDKATADANSQDNVVADGELPRQSNTVPDLEVTSQSNTVEINSYDQALFYQQRNALTNVQVGDEIKFGAYEQDNNPSNGKEEIEWEVLDKKEDQILVISKKALACQEYLENYEETTWEKSTMREWLNGVFLQDAFSPDHQTMIVDGTVTADANPDYGTDTGADTSDKVFLLSISEVEKYFSSQENRICQPTVYAKVHGAYMEDYNAWWWLRTPGKDGKHMAVVYSNGEIRSEGYRVYVKDGTIRPAMWLDLSEVSEVEVPEEYFQTQTQCKGIIAINPCGVGTTDGRTFMEAKAPGEAEEECTFQEGVTGKTTGVNETEINLQVSKELQKILLDRGYQVVMLREDQESMLSQSNRAIAASEAGADIMVLISCRKRQDLGERGAMVYLPKKENQNMRSLYEDCYKLSQCLLKNYCAENIFENNGLHGTDSYAGINWSKIPVSNILLGCISDESDEQKLADQSNWEAMAEGIANGIEEYFSTT